MKRPSEVTTAPRLVVSKYGDLVVTVRDHHVEIREKGKRTRYTVSWNAIYALGAKAAAEGERGMKRVRRSVI